MMCVEGEAGESRTPRDINSMVPTILLWVCGQGPSKEPSQKLYKKFDFYKWWTSTHFSLCLQFLLYYLCEINNHSRAYYKEYIIMWHKYKQISFITYQPSISHLENSELGCLSGVTHLPLSTSKGTMSSGKVPFDHASRPKSYEQHTTSSGGLTSVLK